MPTWGGILQEIAATQAGGQPPNFDLVRRKYLALANQLTGRNKILYASAWTQNKPHVPPNLFAIADEDLSGLMETIHGLSGPSLDLILHSPGGQTDAAEAFVRYLRSKFDDIRVVVPQLAMSAATMIACAGNKIVMGKHSFLGPIDPQIVLGTPLGLRMIPAQAILDQFEQAKAECADRTKLAAWLSMLNQFGPDLLVQCRLVSQLSEELVREWLEMYMFQGHVDGPAKARRIAAWLAGHQNFKTHNRHISRDRLESEGLRIDHLERNQVEQDVFLSILHATTHTFVGTPAVKIIENHAGKAFVNQFLAAPTTVPASPPGP